MESLVDIILELSTFQLVQLMVNGLYQPILAIHLNGLFCTVVNAFQRYTQFIVEYMR